MRDPQVHNDRRERWLQNVAFLGGALVLALVLFVAFSIQSNRRAQERVQSTVSSTAPPVIVTRQPVASPIIPPSPTPLEAYPQLESSTHFPTGPTEIWWLPEHIGILDPGNAGGNRPIQAALFLGLSMQISQAPTTRLDPTVPILTESWHSSPDGRTYTLSLRKDIYWVQCAPQSGQVVRQREVVAEDFVYALERTLQANRTQEVTHLYLIEGVQERLRGESDVPLGVAILDQHTLQLTLTASYRHPSFYPTFLAQPVIWPVPREPVEAYGDAWTEPGHIWVNGAFCPIDWKPGQSITLAPNPWLPNPLRSKLLQEVIPPIAPLPESPAPATSPPQPNPYPLPTME
jgi:ABC-type transport system substrate-binding protein